MTATEPHHHGGAHVHLDENDWAAYAALTELRGEVFMSFLEETIDWIEELRDTDAPAVRRILDILCDEDDPRRRAAPPRPLHSLVLSDRDRPPVSEIGHDVDGASIPAGAAAVV